jgi:hypothetical protein
MKIEKVSYQKLFSIGNFLNERIGFEASIDEGESPEAVVKHLKEVADNLHKEMNPGLEIHVNYDAIPYSNFGSHKENQEEEKIPNGKEERIASIIRQINGCTEKKVLEAFHLLAKSSPEILSAYNKKMEEFV